MTHRTKNSVIRDTLLGNRLIEAPRYIRNIIDCSEFQRLRRIQQTGLTSLVFPTSEHSRFAHSIGVYGTAEQFFKHLQERSMDLDIEVSALKFDEHSQRDFCIAALVHDMGHTAFSHVLESNLLPEEFASHEDCTLALISRDTEIARMIDREADRAAVFQMIDHRHPNRSLGDLVSSTFDVDRCDYVLRDSRMTGVQYGTYDISWLIHSLSVDINEKGQPVLVLDGPRGLDALKQFFSGRRYLYRQVYFHAAVRAAQLLLKAIFERIQHTKDHADHISLAPRCMRSIVKGVKPSLEEFLRITDVEVLFLIREFAEKHRDDVLRYLCKAFAERRLPKPVINSARLSGDISANYRIDLKADSDPDPQNVPLPFFTLPQPPARKDSFEEEIRELVADRLRQLGEPKEIANYLVSWDQSSLPSTPPPNLRLSYGSKSLTFDQVSRTQAGAEFFSLLEPLTIERFFVPKSVSDSVVSHIESRYLIEAEI